MARVNKNAHIGRSKPTTGPVKQELLGYKKAYLVLDGDKLQFQSPTFAVPFGIQAQATCQELNGPVVASHSSRTLVDAEDYANHDFTTCTCGFHSFKIIGDAFKYPNRFEQRVVKKIIEKHVLKGQPPSTFDLTSTPWLPDLVDFLNLEYDKPEVILETVNSGRYVEYAKGYRTEKQRIKRAFVGDCNLCLRHHLKTAATAFGLTENGLEPMCLNHALQLPKSYRYSFDELAARVTLPKDYKHDAMIFKSGRAGVKAATESELGHTPTTNTRRKLRNFFNKF